MWSRIATVADSGALSLTQDVPRILRGSFYRDNVGSKWVEIISSYQDVFDRLDVRPPKIIVAVSISHRSERSLPEGSWAFPAVLDTGFNRVLEIDERHLERWTGYKKQYLDILRANQESENGVYDECAVNLWLHRAPYKNPRDHRDQAPLHLENSSIIRVMHESGDAPAPCMPLLGLQALIQNKLNLRIDSRHGFFVIDKSNSIRFLSLLGLLQAKATLD